MVAWALIEPAIGGALPPEWLVLGGWAVLGSVMWTMGSAARVGDASKELV
jgi:hypothetical protein